MKFKYYLKRLINDKIKLSVIILFLLIPQIEIVQYLFRVTSEEIILRPEMNFFLTGYLGMNTDFIMNTALLWFLPIYLLLAFTDDCIEDFQTGFKNILITRWGKKNYIKTNLVKGFVFSFILMFLALSLNMIFCYIIFSGVTTLRYFGMDLSDLPHLQFSLTHPLLVYGFYTFISSFISGLIGLSNAALSLAIPNRKLIYPIAYMVWFIPFIFRKSSILVLQPFSEYSFKDVIPTFIFIVISYLLITTIATLKETKYAKI